MPPKRIFLRVIFNLPIIGCYSSLYAVVGIGRPVLVIDSSILLFGQFELWFGVAGWLVK